MGGQLVKNKMFCAGWPKGGKGACHVSRKLYFNLTIEVYSSCDQRNYHVNFANSAPK